MSETEYQTITDHRREILKPMFEYIKGAECFYVVGGPSMGKTRLLDFLMREDVQKHYLKEQAGKVWLVRVDMNRLAIRNEPWAFYELLLNSLMIELSSHEDVADRKQGFLDMNLKVLESQDLPIALRHFELAVNMLCQDNIKLCFLLDEFDKTYSSLSPDTFSQLRAVRDANKYFVLYGVFLRDLPKRLRPSPDPDNEDFYELISRNMLGLGPYTKEDTLQILQKLEHRRSFFTTPFQRECLYEVSGGHIGLAQVFLSTLLEDSRLFQMLGTPGSVEWLGQQASSREECRKIWKGLAQDEQDALLAFVKGNHPDLPEPFEKLLSTKGLIRKTDHSPSLFSPVFEQYVRSLG